MFCKYCGCRLDDETTVCSTCGKTLSANIAPVINEDVQILQEDELQDSTEETAESAPDNLPGVMDEDASLCAVEDMPVVTAKKKSKTPGIVILLLLVLCIAVGGGYYVHINSDEYKTEQAQMYFDQQNYEQAAQFLTDVDTPQANELKNQIAIEKALLFINGANLSAAAELLYSVNTPQAEAILSFISVESAKLAFMEAYTAKSLSNDVTEYNQFRQAVNNFENQQVEYYLPENLLASFRLYNAAFDQAELAYHSFNSMMEICSFVIQIKTSNEDKTFKPARLLSAIESERTALKNALVVTRGDSFDLYQIKHALQDDILPHETIDGKNYIYLSDALSAELHSLYNKMQQQLTYCEETYADILKKFGNDGNIYVTNSSSTYTVNLYSSVLVDINDYADYNTNDGAIFCMVKRDMIYYFLTGGKHV